MQQQPALPRLLMAGIISMVLLFFYSDVIFSPNTTTMGDSTDGIKNYYTPWYHAKWDSSYTWFEGMNYPYGEHIVFTDAQPLLSNTIKLLGLADYTIGIINCGLLLSIYLAALLLYQILIRWKVNPWWAALSSVAISLLSPQILKFNGHYALAYLFVVPLIWLLLLRAFEQPSWLRSGLLAITIFCLGWLHPYFVMISALFLTAFWGWNALIRKEDGKFWRGALHFGVQVILPVLLFSLVLKISDPITDRPSAPYGFDQYMSTWKSIFLPLALVPLDSLLPTAWTTTTSWEGISYIGLVSIFCLVYVLGRWLMRLVKRISGDRIKVLELIQNAENTTETNRLILVSALTAMSLGLFACGIPFAFKPELMTELFPPIKQFRSLGRFSWVFYYLWTTISFYIVWNGIQALRFGKGKLYFWLLAGSIALISLFEIGGLNMGVSGRIPNPSQRTPYDPNAETVFGWPYDPGLNQAAQHPAIIVLPFFHEGSENFHTEDHKNSLIAFQTSIKTGVPMLNVMMSRTSLNQSWSMLELLTEPTGNIALVNEIQDKRPLFAIRTGSASYLDGPIVQADLGNVQALSNGVITYPLDLARSIETHIPHPVSIPLQLYPGKGEQFTDRPGQGLLWDDFQSSYLNTHVISGETPGYHSGIGKEIILKDNNLLHNGPVNFAAGDTVIISLWVQMKGDRLPLTELGWEEWKGEEKITWHYLSLNNSIRRIEGDWALCEREEVVQDPNNTIQINVTRWKRIPRAVTVDKFMLRKKGTNVYGIEGGKPVWWNNRFSKFIPADSVQAAMLDQLH